MKIERKWAMPNKNTFEIKPIKELISGCNRNGYKEALAISVLESVLFDKQDFYEKMKEKGIEGEEAERLYHLAHGMLKMKRY